MAGMVYLVGAGPGDPGLLTRRAADLLAAADAVLYDGRALEALLDLAGDDAERVDVAEGGSQPGAAPSPAELAALMAERAVDGKRVVRLVAGDPFVCARAVDEARQLAAAGIGFEVVPGVGSATGVATYAGIPLTARGVAATVSYATGHPPDGAPLDVDWAAIASADTVVLSAAPATLADAAAALGAAGRAADTPAAAVAWGITAAQRTVTATLGTLAERVADAGLEAPVLVVVGEVVRLRDELSWYERRPLFGARVLITRRVEQSGPFAATLGALGAQPIYAPVTRIGPPTDGAPLRKAIDRIDTYEWVVLTSVNAVVRFFDELRASHRDARALGLARVACVGSATAAELAEQGVRADIVPSDGDAVATAKAILGAANGSIRASRVLVPRAEQGREEGIELLRDAGAEVDVVAVYRTAPVPADDPSVRTALRELRSGRVDVATFFAPSQVTALCEMLGDVAATTLNACRVVAAIGKTTRGALEQRGVRVDLVPSRPDAQVLASELAQIYK